MLRFKDDHIAIIETGELGNVKQITYKRLHKAVAECANALRKIGVVKGDRCAGYMPNTADAVIAMLATTSIGAIWSCASPDFGVTVI